MEKMTISTRSRLRQRMMTELEYYPDKDTVIEGINHVIKSEGYTVEEEKLQQIIQDYFEEMKVKEAFKSDNFKKVTYWVCTEAVQRLFMSVELRK